MPDFLTIYLISLVFIFGLCIGSFLNVVILRGLSKESIVFPASKCPKCQHPLKWWHNIPLLSYILLRGKCYFCHGKISPQYFIVELLTGVIFTAVFLKFGISLNTLLLFIIFSLFIVMTVTDLKEKAIFDVHSIMLVVVGVIFSLFHHQLTNSILGILEGILIMEILASVGYLFVKSRAFGLGDTYIAAGLGAIFGWYPLLFVLALSLIIQAIMTLPLYIKKLIKAKNFKTVISIAVFFLILVLFKLISFVPNLNNIILYVGSILVAVSGLYCIRQITHKMKTANDAIILPFGPAMFIAGSLFILLN